MTAVVNHHERTASLHKEHQSRVKQVGACRAETVR